MSASTILGKKLESELYLATDPGYVNNRILKCIAEYIEEEVTFDGIFVGTDDSTSLPVTLNLSFRIETRGLRDDTVVFQDPQGGDGYDLWVDWMSQIYQKISYHCGLNTSPSNPPSFNGDQYCWQMVSPSWGREDLLSAYKSNIYDPQGICLDTLARGIIKDMKIDYIPSESGKVMNSGSYTGVFSVTQVNAPE